MRLIHLGLLAAVLLSQGGCRTSPSAGHSTAPSARGSWTGAWRNAEGNYVERFSLTLSQNGDAITGSGIDEHGEPAKANGSMVRNDVRIKIWNEGGSVECAGVLTGDRIAGTWTMGNERGPFWMNRNGPQNKAADAIGAEAAPQHQR